MNGLSNKQWQLPAPVPEDFVARMNERGMHPTLAQILYRRGFTDPDQAASVLAPYLKDDNPFGLKGMTEAVYRLRMAIRSREPIAIYGDFDCDGVSSTVLLTQVLKQLGANVRPYIPSRVDEGYGLNSPALKSLAEEGVRVVVTVDCGIRSVQEVIDGNSYGLDMIISDHHSIGPEMPPALAVINPKQDGCSYPEKMLAGVGLAYKVAQALYMEARRRGYDKANGWHPSDWLDLVAIGTVADIAPLLGENRMLVHDGLKKLNSPERPGLKALYGVAGVKLGRVTAVTIGFLLGPRINAAGRLRSASLAFDLLSAEEMSQAARLAAELNELNQERQQKTDLMQGWAEEIMPGDLASLPLLFAADARFEQGVVGLVASRLTEAYYRPSVVVQIGTDESHGSCRSIPEFHITHALDRCRDLLERHGGHAAAAGFTVRNDRVDPLRERLQEIAHEELDQRELIPTLSIDAELPLSEVSFEMADALASLEPTGEANRMPLFLARDLSIVERRLVGDGKHLKLVLTDGASRADAIAFRMGEQAGSLPDRIDVAYHLEADEWNERRRLQLNLRDIRPAAGLFEG